MTHLAETEIQAGRYVDARRWVDAARELGAQLASGLVAETWLGGLLDACVGELEAAGATAAEQLRIAAETDDWWRRRIHLLLAGNVALAAGRPAEAASAYTELAAAIDALGLVEPLASRFEPDWVEACVGAGDPATTEQALQRLRRRHDRLPRPWTALGIARSTVLVEAAAGRPVDDALAALDEAYAALPADVVPLERARCLLVAGIAHRRARRKREARERLDAAVAAFDELGAASWAARARAELTRLGERVAAPLELTATEHRVARLAADGRTNRVIADTLFISPKTVEANLARVYRKLGITSRAELGVALAGRRTEG
ncbi:MAG: helix-turn-helix transcriptional regulator [Jatrophihabitans sp.]|uniref:helix-turn-helix transcriptional regulator n=1 Tax=Jatrophihabitans sp. TaxID=1932789 RepID=UPI003F80289F